MAAVGSIISRAFSGVLQIWTEVTGRIGVETVGWCGRIRRFGEIKLLEGMLRIRIGFIWDMKFLGINCMLAFKSDISCNFNTTYCVCYILHVICVV